MVDSGFVECLSMRGIQIIVVLAHFHVEVRAPTQFAIYITLLRKLRILRHPCALDLVLVVGVYRALRV